MSFYLMHRGWMDDPVFKDEPFTEREAFIWMVENAVWEHEGRKKRLTNSCEIITLKRGQLCYSIRFLAKKWQWSLGKVQRYTTRLKIDTLIDTAIDTGELIITICNYDKYQKFSTGRDTANDTAIDTQTIQQPIQRIKNIKELKEYTDDDCSARVEKIFSWLETFFNSPIPYNTAPVVAWLNWGADFDLDIKPAAERYKKRKNQPPRSLSWLDEEITKSINQRNKPMPEYTANAPPDTLESTIDKVRKKMMGENSL